MVGERDFVIEIGGSPGRYRVQVSSPAGEATVLSGLDAAAFAADLRGLRGDASAVANRHRDLRAHPPPRSDGALRRVGSALYAAVFVDMVATLFRASRNEVERRDQRLRLILRAPPELAVLPWELLFEGSSEGFLCRRSTLVRYVDAAEPIRPLAVEPPLRVLGMTALPAGLAALDAGTEQRRMRDLMTTPDATGLMDLEWVDGQTWQSAQSALLHGCHVFHFIGHGGFDAGRGEGEIAFADEHGRPRLVRASALRIC